MGRLVPAAAEKVSSHEGSMTAGFPINKGHLVFTPTGVVILLFFFFCFVKIRDKVLPISAQYWNLTFGRFRFSRDLNWLAKRTERQ